MKTIYTNENGFAKTTIKNERNFQNQQKTVKNGGRSDIEAVF